jgi:carbon storage regulator
MLVLTRKLMEKLFIGDDICVTVVRLEGGQVRLGIEAPREVTVVRAELVPDRACGPHRPSHRSAAPGAPADPGQGQGPGQGPSPAGRGPFRNPPAAAHETDSRRRGPSR